MARNLRFVGRRCHPGHCLASHGTTHGPTAPMLGQGYGLAHANWHRGCGSRPGNTHTARLVVTYKANLPLPLPITLILPLSLTRSLWARLAIGWYIGPKQDWGSAKDAQNQDGQRPLRSDPPSTLHTSPKHSCSSRLSLRNTSSNLVIPEVTHPAFASG